MKTLNLVLNVFPEFQFPAGDVYWELFEILDAFTDLFHVSLVQLFNFTFYSKVIDP